MMLQMFRIGSSPKRVTVRSPAEGKKSGLKGKKGQGGEVTEYQTGRRDRGGALRLLSAREGLAQAIIDADDSAQPRARRPLP